MRKELNRINKELSEIIEHELYTDYEYAQKKISRDLFAIADVPRWEENPDLREQYEQLKQDQERNRLLYEELHRRAELLFDLRIQYKRSLRRFRK